MTDDEIEAIEVRLATAAGDPDPDEQNFRVRTGKHEAAVRASLLDVPPLVAEVRRLRKALRALGVNP